MLSSLSSWTLCTLFKPCANGYSQPPYKSTLTVMWSTVQCTLSLQQCMCLTDSLQVPVFIQPSFQCLYSCFFDTHAYTRTCTNIYQSVETSATHGWQGQCEWRSYTLLHLYSLHRVDCVVSIHSFTLLCLYTSDRKRCMCHSNKDLHLQIGSSHETKRSYLQAPDCHLDLLFFH